MKYLKYLIAILLVLSIGCRSKKAALEKKEKTLNELHQNDIKIDEQDIEVKEIIKISKSQNWSFEPADPSKASRVISDGDTLDFINTKIKIENSEARETEKQEKTSDRSLEDNSSKEIEISEKEKKKDKQTKSASWGLNLGLIFVIIAAGIMLYLQLKTGGLDFKKFFRIKR